MNKILEGTEIINEEQLIVKWFLGLFYFILLSYDFFYFYILPKFFLHKKPGVPSIYYYLIYLTIIVLIPVTRFIINANKHHLVKYVYFISYILVSIISDVLSYYGHPNQYRSGNILDVFLLLFSPLFINNQYFWIVAVGILLKYLLVGLALKSTIVLIPIILLLVFGIMSFILLTRFQGYVYALKNSYNKQLEGIVRGIIATLELKDPYTRGHSERVASYALSLVKHTGKYSEEELIAFNYACLLHDIGKINIPDHILLKPSKLTEEEFSIIKQHPSVGADAIKNIVGLETNIGVILSHHERWDGNGYPDKLNGEDIPFLARVTAIADAFDAMTSSRSYRAALPLEEAYKRIIEGKGTQFDPNLVEIFKTVFPTWVDFHNKYPWSKKSEIIREVNL
jgi:HD-GYP domain-containing protein (c-di-GMP phosphodiesterase class II)